MHYEGKALGRSSHWRCSAKKGTLELLPQACNFIRKESMAQVFSSEFYKIFKNTFFTEQL